MKGLTSEEKGKNYALLIDYTEAQNELVKHYFIVIVIRQAKFCVA